ncbi:MAG TPA: ATP-binding cassette domain-containing protein [Firmicutes bacterium]|nr:ATP-binding cassette domain-containing protein [Bacillota bacterium]
MKLEASNISFAYHRKGEKILDRFSMTVESHERVGLLAPSGFGKTTLCQILAGYLKPDSGTVLLDGEPLPQKGVCPVQMIWQHPEKVVNPRLKMGETLAEGDHIPPRIIEELGIEKDWFHRYPGELSGGEMQRFCIARALGESTRFIIADEISTMLDLITQSQIWNFLLKEVREREIGLVAVTHSDALMERITTRVIHLESEDH